ncbi:MAG TPA: alpha/beta hydrolase [Opitutus sp.]|nr:alpha/beta hydrolase [Opitutus sp.]
MKITALVLCIVFLWGGMGSAAALDSVVVPLWAGVAPGSEGKTGEENVRLSEGGEHIVSNIHRPSLTVYLPSGGAATKLVAGVIVIPGGGHRELWMDHEGYNIAQRLAARGIAAFVLKYRLAREEGSTYRVDRESLRDVQRALRLVRHRASEWRVDPARLGVMGFSAGGELAALAAMHVEPERGETAAGDAIDRESARPAFQALIYPGKSDAIEPGEKAPPAFLVCGAQDRPDISEGLARAYLRFKLARVPAELHIYAHAGHGFGLRATNRSALAGWLERFGEWLVDGGFVEGASAE